MARTDSRNGLLDSAVDLNYFAVRRYLAAADKMLSERGLSRAHHRILHFIERNPGVTVQELCAIIGVSRQAVQKPLKRLQNEGLLEGEPMEDDLRRRALRLTSSGRDLQQQLNETMREFLRKAFDAAGQDNENGWFEVTRRMAGS